MQGNAGFSHVWGRGCGPTCFGGFLALIAHPGVPHDVPDPFTFEIHPDRNADELFPAGHVQLREDVKDLSGRETRDQEAILRVPDEESRLGFAFLVITQPGGDDGGGVPGKCEGFIPGAKRSRRKMRKSCCAPCYCRCGIFRCAIDPPNNVPQPFDVSPVNAMITPHSLGRAGTG